MFKQLRNMWNDVQAVQWLAREVAELHERVDQLEKQAKTTTKKKSVKSK